MDDVYRSLFVILPVGMAICILLFFNTRRKRELRLRLEAYCSQRGYRMNRITQRLHRAAVILGDGWQLTTGVQSSDAQTQSGSSYTVSYTRWETVPKAEEDDPMLWLGTVPGSAAPPGDALLPLLSLFGINGKEPLHFAELSAPLRGRFALLTTETLAAEKAGADLANLLADWPEGWPLRAVLGRSSVQITIPGRRFDKPQDLDRIIHLGTDFLAYHASLTIHTNDE